MAKAQPSKRAKYSREVEEIRRMRDLSRILKAGDVENALLSNSAKDSETMNDNVLDNLLENANNVNRNSERGLELIERLTVGSGAGTRVVRSRPASRKARAAPKRRAARAKPRTAKKRRKR